MCSPASGSTFALGETTVSCSKTDARGNDGNTVSFKVTVVDTTAPVIDAMSNIEQEATLAGTGGVPAGVVTWMNPQWTDIVDGVGSADCTPSSGSAFALDATTSKVHTVTCSRTDLRGNVAADVTFTVTIKDSTKPTIADPANSNIDVEATGSGGVPAGVAMWTNPQWTDIVD